MTQRMTVNRREFLEQVAAWSAGLTVATPLIRITPALGQAVEGEAAALPVLAVAKGEDCAALVESVLKPLGGISAFVKKNDKVVVKPNIGWDRTPAQAATTNPEVVKALVQQALKAGAKEVLVFDRPCVDPRLSYKNSGIRDAVESIDDKRVSCFYPDDRKYVPVKIANGKVIQEWDLYDDAIKADCYINVPIAKHHGLSRLTLGLKNVMGVMGGRRGKIHRQLPASLADINLVVAPKLTVIDATRILLRRGPQGGDLNDVKQLNTLIASADIVAADAYATTLFDLKPEEIPTTVAAHERGMGEMNLEKVKIVTV